MGLAREYQAPVDLLVTDVVMPGMSSPELAKNRWNFIPRRAGCSCRAIPRAASSVTAFSRNAFA